MGKVLLVVVLLAVGFYCWKTYNKDTMNVVNGGKNIGIHLLKDGAKQIDKMKTTDSGSISTSTNHRKRN